MAAFSYQRNLISHFFGAKHKACASFRELEQLMVGKERLDSRGPLKSRKTGKPMLTVQGFDVYADHGGKVLDGLHFQVNEGEIVGVAGVYFVQQGGVKSAIEPHRSPLLAKIQKKLTML